MTKRIPPYSLELRAGAVRMVLNHEGVHARIGSAIAGKALERIDALCAVEREITGQRLDRRHRQHQDGSRLLADSLST